MKNNQKGFQAVEFVREYGSIIFHNLGQALIGGIWWLLFFCFIAFIYNYHWYYKNGVKMNQLKHKLVYDDLDKRAR
jgi:hypothetical protein